MCLIFSIKCGIVAEIYNYWVQPLMKRESVWMDHKNPVSGSGDGVFISDSDIQMKPTKCSDCGLWQDKWKIVSKTQPQHVVYHHN
jgi:hypothetical protein